MSRLPVRRMSLRRVAAAGGTVLLAGAGLMAGLHPFPAAADQPTYYFEGETTATAVHLTVTQKPSASIITASLVDDAAGYAASAYDSSGGSEAQAAPLFPGNLVVQGPTLLCEDVFGSDPFPACPVAPPSYPLLADASYPRTKVDHAQTNGSPVGSGPLVLTPARADATAAADGNEGSTAGAALSLLSGSPAAVTIGAAASSSTLHTTASDITVHVESSVQDVTVAGLVHIAAVHAIDDITVTPTAKPVDHPSITVTGVTVAGQPASIDGDGIHIAGQNGPSLAQKLAQLGVTLRTVGVNRADSTGVARSDATGLSIGFSVPVSGLPYIPNPLPPPFDVVPGVNGNGTYVGTITLGAAGAAAAGQTQPGFSLGGIVTPVTPVPPATVPPTTTGGGGSAPPLVGQPVPPVSPPIVAGRPSPVRVLLDAFSLKNLYAGLALGTVLMFVSWRGLLAYRSLRRGWRPFAGRGA
ncbi:MAG: hypothetical protein JO079_13600 [Frankiaceae bacterium]|nr:hypothetical protein [Frankiaceae bacterium]